MITLAKWNNKLPQTNEDESVPFLLTQAMQNKVTKWNIQVVFARTNKTNLRGSIQGEWWVQLRNLLQPVWSSPGWCPPHWIQPVVWCATNWAPRLRSSGVVQNRRVHSDCSTGHCRCRCSCKPKRAPTRWMLCNCPPTIRDGASSNQFHLFTNGNGKH